MDGLTSHLKFLSLLGVSAGVAIWLFFRRLGVKDVVTDVINSKPRYLTRYIELEPWMVGAIIGKRGYTISKLQMETKCLLRIVHYDPESALKAGNTYPYLSNYNDKDTRSSDDEDWNAEVRPKKSSVKTPFLEAVFREEAQYNHLLQLVQELISNTKEKRVHRKVFIPKESALHTYGLYGRNVRRIQRSTRVVVEIALEGIEAQSNGQQLPGLNGNQEEVLEGKVAVYFYGPEKNLQIAEEMLLKYVEDYYYKFGYATNQKVSLAEYDEPTVSEILERILKVHESTKDDEEF